MKYNRLLSFMGLLLLILPGYAQQPVVFNPTDPYQKAFLLRQGQKVDILCDSAYVITKLRYNLYEKAVQGVRNTNYANVYSLIEAYENALKLCQQSYDTLFGKYNATYNYSMSAIDKSTGDLKMINKDLKSVNDSLITAQHHLDVAIKEVKATRSQKYLWGIGGLGLGAVTGIIVGLLLH